MLFLSGDGGYRLRNLADKEPGFRAVLLGGNRQRFYYSRHLIRTRLTPFPSQGINIFIRSYSFRVSMALWTELDFLTMGPRPKVGPRVPASGPQNHFNLVPVGCKALYLTN